MVLGLVTRTQNEMVRNLKRRVKEETGINMKDMEIITGTNQYIDFLYYECPEDRYNGIMTEARLYL